MVSVLHLIKSITKSILFLLADTKSVVCTSPSKLVCPIRYLNPSLDCWVESELEWQHDLTIEVQDKEQKDSFRTRELNPGLLGAQPTLRSQMRASYVTVTPVRNVGDFERIFSTCCIKPSIGGAQLVGDLRLMRSL